MAKAAILCIDDEPEVLRAVERDLRRRYAKDYRVLRAESGANGLETLNELKRRNEPLALIVADQRMPQMSGVEFITTALKIFPDCKRVLLTAYADTSAAIEAINTIHINNYLLKPWSPPEENLYPVLDDLLADWAADFRPDFSGLRVVGSRWSPASHAVKDFLARNHVPYQWLDAAESERDTAVRKALETLSDDEKANLPIVILPDGEHLQKPEPAQIANKIGLSTKASEKFYDLAIVGGGPGGLAAAVYAASEGLKTVMIEREAPGGQAGMSSRIENYLGFPSGLSGGDLARRAVTQAKRFGVEILAPQEAKTLRIENQYKFLTLADDSEISCHALMIATGVQWRKLDVPGVERLSGAGVYYGAAMVEALSCQDETVFVVGGANSAGQAAMFFSNYASEVVMLVRGDSLEKGMSQYLVDQINQTPNIRVELNRVVAEAHGETHLEAVTTKCLTSGETTTSPAASLFIFIGAVPQTDWLDKAVMRDERSFILSGADTMKDGKRPTGWTEDRDPFLLETSAPGIFVVGDVRKNSIKRVASSVGEGSIAVSFVHQYLSKVI